MVHVLFEPLLRLNAKSSQPLLMTHCIITLLYLLVPHLLSLVRREKEASDALARKFKEENEEAIRTEAAKQARAKEENTRIKLIQLEEGKLAQKKRMEDKLIEIEQDRFLATINRDNDEKFLEACKAEIERNVKLGKPVYTILRAMEYTAPALLAAKTMKK